jgi:hypothetical protein
MKLWRRVALLAIGLAVTSVCMSFEDAGAQPKRAPAKPPAKKPPPTPARTDDLDASAPLAGKEGAEPKVAAADAGKAAVILDQKTLDGGTRVFRFGEVEIEGRLKSPQIVYFLRRVRAEFAAGDLGHRSFFPELGETKNEPVF